MSGGGGCSALMVLRSRFSVARVIYLRCCLGVSRIGSARRGHTVALYATDQTVALVAEDPWEQEEWYQAVKKLMEEEERKDEEHDEEDDGYCTLPPAASFREVRPCFDRFLSRRFSSCFCLSVSVRGICSAALSTHVF